MSGQVFSDTKYLALTSMSVWNIWAQTGSVCDRELGEGTEGEMIRHLENCKREESGCGTKRQAETRGEREKGGRDKK